MILAITKQAAMTILNAINFVTFQPLPQTNPAAARRRKLITKVDKQIQLAKDPSYSPKSII